MNYKTVSAWYETWCRHCNENIDLLVKNNPMNLKKLLKSAIFQQGSQTE
jgi:hypothetical protein